ncbi:type 1 fimbrial protein [Proteus vulgaris]|nr:type 1 fimbrial protein [Proteus vulgaris]
MKLSKIALAAALVFGINSVATAETPAPKVGATKGEIQLKGEIVNSACGLAASSSPVIVDFSEIPTSALANMQKAGNVKKDIELQDCDTTVAKTATVSYTPSVVNATNKDLASFVSGSGIGLMDAGSKSVKWNTATTPVQLVNGVSKIPFVAYVQAESADATVTPGEFQAVINFQVDYQ